MPNLTTRPLSQEEIAAFDQKKTEWILDACLPEQIFLKLSQQEPSSQRAQRTFWSSQRTTTVKCRLGLIF
jgi:hypothetical protein